MKSNTTFTARKYFSKVIVLVILLFSQVTLSAQHSVARKWNETLLLAIRNDFARPPVHARNLFHLSAAMYDAWAAYDAAATTWLLGKWNGDYYCEFDGVPVPSNVELARNEAISFAAYRIILHRFSNSPGKAISLEAARDLMIELGYNPDLTSTDYSDGLPSSLGNYIAQSFIDFGFQDGSNEDDFYRSQFYFPVNPPLIIKDSGNPFIIDPNRWQPLFLETFIDQSGNTVPSGAANFLAPEWGGVTPFSLSSEDLTIYQRDGNEYRVYYDPGPPPMIQADGGGSSSEYKWGFTMVSKWGANLDHTDGVMWDISPGAMGNVDEALFIPTPVGFRQFYDENEGGDPGKGRAVNPKTGEPYAPQIVPRGDYTRVLAEFWADGPDSETPPGHWFTILNYVIDHPQFERKYKGMGEQVDALEWDVKAYFTLGGAMHDVAIACWGTKGWYDYIRPVSAIRYMAERGQSTDSNLPNYSTNGIPLTEGFVELVAEGDPLAGAEGEHVGKIKLYTWRGPEYIEDPTTDLAGVGWILAENWWPYQRPTFVTPPFAGYTSGHSTYSRAAAEVMTYITGDEYFPGGMGEFPAPQEAFLVFEKGPSVDVTLQWATYRDASDQCSLSRIWGGIHPPQDDIAGRIAGKKIGVNAAKNAEHYFLGLITSVEKPGFQENLVNVYPNPAMAGEQITISLNKKLLGSKIQVLNIHGAQLKEWVAKEESEMLSTQDLKSGFYILRVLAGKGGYASKIIVR